MSKPKISKALTEKPWLKTSNFQRENHAWCLFILDQKIISRVSFDWDMAQTNPDF